MNKRKEEAKKTKEKIKDSIKNLINSGSEDFTVEEITKKAGIAKGTFYTYFDRKEDALFELTNEDFFSISNSLSNSTKSVYERLKIFLTESASIIEDKGLNQAKNWMKYAVNPIKNESKGMDKYKYDYTFITDCLEFGVSSQELNQNVNIQGIADEIICSYYGAVTIWCLTNGQKNLSNLIQKYVNSSLKLLVENLKK